VGSICHLTKAIVRKIWYESENQLSQQTELSEKDQPDKLESVTALIYSAKEVKDFYPVDPASPTYIVEAFNDTVKQVLCISGNLIMFEDNTAEKVEGGLLTAVFDRLLEESEVKIKSVSKLIKELSAKSI